MTGEPVAALSENESFELKPLFDTHFQYSVNRNDSSGRRRLLWFSLLLLLLSSCASQPQRSQTLTEKNFEEDQNFFYDGLLPQKSTPEDREDRKYFFDGVLGKL